MANSLNITIEAGQKAKLINGPIVFCQGGFGMASFTSGTALFVSETEGGETFRVSGYDIEKLID